MLCLFPFLVCMSHKHDAWCVCISEEDVCVFPFPCLSVCVSASQERCLVCFISESVSRGECYVCFRFFVCLSVCITKKVLGVFSSLSPSATSGRCLCVSVREPIKESAWCVSVCVLHREDVRYVSVSECVCVSVCLSACLRASQGRCRRCYRLFSFATIKIFDVFPSQSLFASQVKCLVCFRLPVCQVICLVCFRLPVCQVIYLVCFRLYVSQRRFLEWFRSCVYLSRDSPPFKKIFRESPPPPPHTLRCSLQCGQVMWNTSCGTQEQFAESIASSYSVEHVTAFIILKVIC